MTSSERFDYDALAVEQHLLQHDLCKALFPEDSFVTKAAKTNRFNYRRIAQVGDGAGIWLREAADVLKTPGQHAELVVFDSHELNILRRPLAFAQYVRHDLREPFPAIRCQKFGLVHLGPIARNFSPKEIGNALRNTWDIVAQDGLLEWQDFEMNDVSALPTAMSLLRMNHGGK
jgi:hypothetical protein